MEYEQELEAKFKYIILIMVQVHGYNKVCKIDHNTTSDILKFVLLLWYYIL